MEFVSVKNQIILHFRLACLGKTHKRDKQATENKYLLFHLSLNKFRDLIHLVLRFNKNKSKQMKNKPMASNHWY